MTLTDYLLRAPAAIRARNKTLVLTLLFLGSVLALLPGIGKITGVTTKDEYFLIYGTALTMAERHEWLVPHLDGAPRIRKPPLISWLARASFELLGVSVSSGRLVGVFFAALFVVVVALIGFECTRDLNYGVSAALIALSTGGLAVQGRFLMLDIPTAALSGLGFYWFLRWCKSQRPLWMVAAAASLACGFLTKGPAVGVLFGSGVIALVLTSAETRSKIQQKRGVLCVSFLLFLGLSLPWFASVYWLYPEYSLVDFQKELEERQIGQLTLQPLLAAGAIFFPWTFLLIPSFSPAQTTPAGDSSWRQTRAFLMLWCGFSLAPFLFLKFSERYILGSLMPIALLTATAFLKGTEEVRIYSRWGIVVTSFVVFSAAVFSWWFKTAFVELIGVVVAYVIFVGIWWHSRGILPMAVSATMLWTALVGFLYPTFGANAIPSSVVERVKGERVFLYREPQPAFLAVTLGRSLERVVRIELRHLQSGNERCPWIFVTEHDRPSLEQELRALGVDPKPVHSYKTLGQVEHVIRSALKPETWNHWIVAFRTRSPEPIMQSIFLYRLGGSGACQTTSTTPKESGFQPSDFEHGQA